MKNYQIIHETVKLLFILCNETATCLDNEKKKNSFRELIERF